MPASTFPKTTFPPRFRQTLWASAILFFFGTLPAGAQSRARGPIVLELPASTRALALGNSFALDSRSSEALFYQPGFLSRGQGFSGSIQRYGASSTLISLVANGSWLSGGVSLGVQQLSYGASTDVGLFGGVRPSHLLELPADIGSLRDNGNIGVSELVISAGLGKSVKGIQVGVVGKLVEQRFGPHKASTGAVDFGAITSPGPVTLGLAVQNLGPAMTVQSEEIPLPLRFALGASTQSTEVGPLDLAASGTVSYRMDGDVIPSLGLELGYWPVTGRTFVARVGFRHLPDEQSGCPLTFGGAFWGDNIMLDYAYEGFDSGSPSHRFSIGWR